jgi:ubiquinone/menaquinone biosynthesis C-methylase UbiE
VPYPDCFFDKVYSTMAVHHFPDQEKSIEELARVLKPKGFLVIVDISPQTFLGRLARLFENGLLRHHLNFLGAEELCEMLRRRGGFDVEQTEQKSSIYFVRASRRGSQS